MTRLILIRHGQTDYNLQNRYCGFSDPPLNSRGIWQSGRLAACLRNIKIDKVYSSDLKRSYQTAGIIFKKHSIEETTDFREINFGCFEGLKHGEILEKYPRLYNGWMNDPETIKIPGSEGLKGLSKRVKKALSFILSQNEGKTVALVTHGGVIKLILCDALRFDLKMFWRIEQTSGALNIIDYSGELLPEVVRANDISHLSVGE